ncbi:MmgE/PrpD family protein [Oricola sp.]|uniref:MmgE/PrpD family protein n=1 Tax=Oricola sp. TaxID=1979950 RepID=UPI003BAB9E1A
MNVSVSAVDPSASTNSAETVAARLARIVTEQSFCRQPDSVVHAAKRCVIDWFSAALPGAATKPARALERGLLDELGHGNARTLSGRRAPMRTAALINGLASHVVEFDDIFAPAIYHPGSPTIAAALAAAMGLNKTGRDLINAVIAGYEASTRVGAAMGPAHYRYWHNTGTIGSVGATAAVAFLFELTPSETAEALATSTTMAAGLQNAFRGNSEIKPLHAGHAADSGFVATALAQNGVVAASDMFEGDTGFGAAMSKDVDWNAALVNPDQFNILRTTVKNHGCCGHTFAALDGALALQDEHGFAAMDIASIRVGGYSATVDVTGNQIADTPGSAKFCLPFIVASGLVHGSIRLDAYSGARLNDPVVRDMMPRITVELDPEVDRLFPTQRAANIWITLNNGTELHRFQPHRVGDPDLPLSDDQLSDKFMELTTGCLQPKSARDLLNALWQLERQTDLEFILSRL